MMNRFAIALCALLLAACSDNETQAGADAAPSDDAQGVETGVDAADGGTDADASADADAECPYWQPGCYEAGDNSFDDACEVDASNTCYLFTPPGILDTPWMQCWDEHTTLTPHDMHGRCTFDCRDVHTPKVINPDYVKTCGFVGGECRAMNPGGAPFCVPKP